MTVHKLSIGALKDIVLYDDETHSPINDVEEDGTPVSAGKALVIADGDGNAQWTELPIGSAIQAWDAHLDQLAAISPSTGDHIYYNGSAWVAVSQLPHVADPAATANALVDSTGGTPSGTYTLVDCGATYDQAKVEDNFATLAAEVNRLRADVMANNVAIDAILVVLESVYLMADS